MALSDLAVYSEYAYSTMTEVLRQQVDLFNAASNNTIRLRPAAHQGDYADEVWFGKVAGLIRRRNAYGSGTVAEKTMRQIVETMVKIATGTPPVRLDPGQFKWIQMNPEVAGAALGQQLAKDTLADMLNTGLGACYAALSQVAANKYDATGNVDPQNKMSFANQNLGVSKFGDAGNQVLCWIMHSKPIYDLYASNLSNSERLFMYGSVNIVRDPFGRVMIMTDSPSLVNQTGNPNTTVYHSLGLTDSAIMIDQNNDYTANQEDKNGNENITRTWQAEWSYNLGIKGFAWDKQNGGKSPTDAAILVSTNWDQFATSNKDLAGVVVETR